VSFFFDKLPAVHGTPQMLVNAGSEPAAPDYIDDFLASREGLDLAKGFMALKSDKLRRRVVDLVEQMAA
jgi:hypothetical protein